MPDDVVVDTPTDGGDSVTESGTETEGKTYSEAAYKALQKENQQYRERWGQYEKTFSQPDTQVFIEAAKAVTEGRSDEVAAWLIRNTAALNAKDADSLAEWLEAGGDPEDFEEGEQPLTRAEVQQMLAERDQAYAEQNQQAQVNQIWQDVEAMGYERNTRDWRRVLDLAFHETDGDLEAASKALKGEKQAAIDEYLNERKADREGSLRPNTGQAPATSRKITMDNAAEIALEMMERDRGPFFRANQ